MKHQLRRQVHVGTLSILPPMSLCFLSGSCLVFPKKREITCTFVITEYSSPDSSRPALLFCDPATSCSGVHKKVIKMGRAGRWGHRGTSCGSFLPHYVPGLPPCCHPHLPSGPIHQSSPPHLGKTQRANGVSNRCSPLTPAPAGLGSASCQVI